MRKDIIKKYSQDIFSGTTAENMETETKIISFFVCLQELGELGKGQSKAIGKVIEMLYQKSLDR